MTSLLLLLLEKPRYLARGSEVRPLSKRDSKTQPETWKSRMVLKSRSNWVAFSKMMRVKQMEMAPLMPPACQRMSSSLSVILEPWFCRRDLWMVRARYLHSNMNR